MKRHVATLLAIALLLAVVVSLLLGIWRPATSQGARNDSLNDGRVAPAAASVLPGTPLGAPAPFLPAVPHGAQELILSVPASHDGRHGTWAYAVASHGSRYLAIPEGRGWIVEVCGPLDCLERVSTDAGPELWLQRAGRIGDLSSVDFRVVCGPTSVGLCRGGSYTILGAADQSGDDPAPHPADDRMRAEDSVTAPPTDVDR